MTPRRGRSLFWTFAGVFLLVLLIGTVLQIVISATILRPLAAQRVREQAGHTLARVSQALASLPDHSRSLPLIEACTTDA